MIVPPPGTPKHVNEVDKKGSGKLNCTALLFMINLSDEQEAKQNKYSCFERFSDRK